MFESQNVSVNFQTQSLTSAVSYQLLFLLILLDTSCSFPCQRKLNSL